MAASSRKIALVNVVSYGDEEKLRIPVNLVYLGSALKKAGYPVSIYHPLQREQDIKEVEENIIREKPLFVGFSVFMGPGSVVSLDMSYRIKNALDIKIVWGGKFATSIYEQVTQEKCIDAVCLGEGEKTIVELAEAFEKGESLENINGIGFRCENKTITTKPRTLVHDLDSLPYDLTLIKDWKRYITTLNGKPALLDIIESQRGCPFNCSFCYQSREMYNTGSKKVIRSHSVEWVLKKVAELKRLTNVEYISFCDDEFWINHNRSFEIIEELYQMGIKFYKLRMRFSSLRNAEMIERITRNEIFTLNLGLESGVNRILTLMNKKLTTEKALEKIRLLAKYPEISAGSAVIMGNPTETKEEVIKSVRFALKLCRENKNFAFGVNLYKPLPGTIFFNMVVKLGFVPPTDIRGWVNVEHKLAFKLAHSWLPWFNRREEQNYLRVLIYLKLYSYVRNNHIRMRKKNMAVIINPVTWLKKILEYIVVFRLYNWFFRFPVEIYLRSTILHLQRIIR